MKFNIVTIFPELIDQFVKHGLMARAIDGNLLEVKTWDPRTFSDDKNNRIDDKPFGGGQGMLIKAEPIIKTVNEIKRDADTHVIFVAPHGEKFNQNKALELKQKNNLTIICGRYEGLDYRIEENVVDEVISIGDFILNGGELPALIIMESIARLEEGFVGNENSLIDSFSNGLLEYPQYTRPEKSTYGDVPEILLSGNHEKVQRWKLKESLRVTLLRRPDLLLERTLSDIEIELLNEIKGE